MKKIISVLILFLIFVGKAGNCAAPVYIPIESISLSYNATGQSLHVQAHHPADDPTVEYIRMMTVAVNGQQVVSNNYDHQDGQDFSDDATVKAQPGDTITVDLFCTGGMSKSLDLTVTDATTSTAEYHSDGSS